MKKPRSNKLPGLPHPPDRPSRVVPLDVAEQAKRVLFPYENGKGEREFAAAVTLALHGHDKAIAYLLERIERIERRAGK
jgi:hypothetical protein